MGVGSQVCASLVCQTPPPPERRLLSVTDNPISASSRKGHCHLIPSGWVFPGLKHLVGISLVELRDAPPTTLTS